MHTEEKLLAKLPGQDTGITVHNSFCDICAPGPHCGISCYVKDGTIIKVEGTDAHPTNHGKLCARGLSARDYIYRKDRIQTPLKRTGPKGSGQFTAISWDEAMAEIAKRLKTIKAESGASSVAFYSGYNKWYRPFLQRLAYSFGSVNYGSESSSCFTSTIVPGMRHRRGDGPAGPGPWAGVIPGLVCQSRYFQLSHERRSSGKPSPGHEGHHHRSSHYPRLSKL